MRRRSLIARVTRVLFALALTTLAFAPAAFAAEAKRLVLLKIDGLSHEMIERFVNQRNPQTGKSALPWIDYVFYRKGTRLSNFYVRGMSLSGPSWSMLDTGQHLQIKGNVEFDRYTFHSYDYLNFIPFWIGNVGRVRIDMPGPELMDEVGTPLFVDAYPYEQRYHSFQLFQRGLRWSTLERMLKNYVRERGPKGLFDEWHVGIGGRTILMTQLERELIEKLNNPEIRYLDFYSTDFDHTTHHNRDRAAHLNALRELDGLVGRVWSAIQKAPLADETALVLVSDHGTNTDERIYSQGYNLVKLLGSANGGGHHVVTKRRLMSDYALKGIYPLIPLIYTTTDDSFYLKGQSTSYPTAMIDFDGNERASIQLRDSDLNLMHILLLELKRKDLKPEIRRAATRAFFDILERRRDGWQRTLDELNEEVGALRRLIEQQRKIVASQPKKWTKEDRDTGRDHVAMRNVARLDSWSADERDLTKFMLTLANRLALRPESFDPFRIRVEDMISQNSMGDHNSIYQLQNYVAGVAQRGLVLASDGALDIEKSFQRINYYTLLSDLRVRNNVQSGVVNRPVDFIAMRVPVSSVGITWDDGVTPDDMFWLHGDSGREALILARGEASGPLQLRYLPIKNLKQASDGSISFEHAPFDQGFPLAFWEDPQINLPAGKARGEWLSAWHTELEWLRTTHLSRYSNAIIGIHEQLARHPLKGLDPSAPGISTDEKLIRRFRRRQRELVESDLLVLASDHWNFDVRGFNPGGNHGSFFRSSTHSALMFTGGAKTGIPQDFVVQEPYDSLSLMPTLMTLTGQLPDPNRPVPISWSGNIHTFPGRLIEELFTHSDAKPMNAARPSVEATP
jgi:hypothetical protein